MARNETANITITLNGENAEAGLKRLEEQATQVRQELREMRLTKDPELPKKQAELNKLEKAIGRAKKESLDFDRVLKNLSGASLKELRATANALDRDLKKMPRTTEAQNQAWKKKQKQLTAVNAEMSRLQLQIRGVGATSQAFSQIAAGFNKYFLVFGTITASLAGLVLNLRRVIEEFNQFEESVANLSSLTGLSGENLKWLEDQAKQLSTTTLEGGVRIRQSAKEIVDAYTLIGSKMPILLLNKEALNEVTKAAIVLAESGKIPLETAANSMAAAINQFGLEASQSTELINLFAAASQLGAGNINYIGESITRFGAAAKGLKVPIEDATIAVQLLAKGGLEASVAGTGMRRFLLNSAQAADEFNVEIVGLRQVIENMNKAQLTTIQLQEMFQMEGFMVAAILKDNVEEYIRLEKGIIGTNTAYEMAATNTQINAAKLQQAKNKAQLFRIELGERLAPALTFSTNGFAYLLRAIKIGIEFFEKNRILIISLAQAYLTYIVILNWATIKTALLTVAKKGLAGVMAILIPQKVLAKKAILTMALAYNTLTGNVGRAAAAKKALAAISKATPWGLIAAGIVAVTVGLIGYIKRKQESTVAEKAHQKVLKAVDEEFDQQAATIQKLTTIIENGEAPRHRRDKAIKDLKEIMPEYNAHINEEGRLIGHNTTLIKDYLTQLRRSIEIKVKEAEITELYKERLRLTREVTKAEQKLEEERAEQKFQPVLTFMGWNAALLNAQNNLQNTRRELKETEDAIKSFEGELYQRYEDSSLEHVIAEIGRINALLYKTVPTRDGGFEIIPKSGVKNAEELKTRLNELYKIRERLINQQPTNNQEDILGDGKPDPTLDKTIGAYQALTNQINEYQTALQNLVAQKKYDDALDVGNALKSLEAYKRILDGIIAKGGNLEAYLDSITDPTDALAEEALWDAEQTKKLHAEIAERTKDARDTEERNRRERQEAENDEFFTRIERNLEEDELNKARHNLRMERLEEWRRAYIDIAHSIANTINSIFANSNQHRLDMALMTLEREKAAILASEDHTAEEKAAIEEEFRQKEAAIKTKAWERDRGAKIIMSIINTALAVTEALPNVARAAAAAIAGAAQTAVIIAQPVPQFFGGKYPVIGQEDGSLYRATPVATKTGLYTQPALIAEKGAELVIDNPTYRNIRLNAPEIIQGIMAHRVPQYASGKYTGPNVGGGSLPHTHEAITGKDAEKALMDAMVLFLNAVNRFDKATQRELSAKISLLDLKTRTAELDRIEKETRIIG